MSVTIFDDLISKFSFIKDYRNELYLVKILLLYLLKYDGHNIYIYEGIRFYLISYLNILLKLAEGCVRWSHQPYKSIIE